MKKIVLFLVILLVACSNEPTTITSRYENITLGPWLLSHLELIENDKEVTLDRGYLKYDGLESFEMTDLDLELTFYKDDKALLPRFVLEWQSNGVEITRGYVHESRGSSNHYLDVGDWDYLVVKLNDGLGLYDLKLIKVQIEP